VKDLHNFLVGDLGVVVHNNYACKIIKTVAEIQHALKHLNLKGGLINGKLFIPENWVYSKINDGARYTHPTNPKIQIRVLEKGKKPQYIHNYEKPYCRYELGKDGNNTMRHADIYGNIVDLNDPNYYAKTHIIIENITMIE